MHSAHAGPVDVQVLATLKLAAGVGDLSTLRNG